uniref:Uncharacterized protein n=1 Tax=uncultured bacterium Contigcl_1556 TaxID=1393652 RepID=W0FSC9_9BACT|nr:hypothetical protein [uncultured bacterium Contigcl_1556]
MKAYHRPPLEYRTVSEKYGLVFSFLKKNIPNRFKKSTFFYFAHMKESFSEVAI